MKANFRTTPRGCEVHHDSPPVIWVGTFPASWDIPVINRNKSLLGWHGAVIHVGGDEQTLKKVAALATLAGACAVLATPAGSITERSGRLENLARTSPMPWWTRRFARYVFATQEEARAWSAPLGRLAVARNAEDLGVLYTEVWRMAT